MNFLKRVIFVFAVFFVMIGVTHLKTYAQETPVFDSLSPNLQKIMRLNAQQIKNMFPKNHIEEALESIAESRLIVGFVTIDGTLYKSYKGPMKLNEEDIESLYNLPCVRRLELIWFDLGDVDIAKLLKINNNKTMEFLSLNSCFFDNFDERRFRSKITKKDYILGMQPQLWIAWPGVDPNEILRIR